MSDIQDNNEPLKTIIVYKSYTEAQKRGIYKYQSQHREQINEYSRKWREANKNKDIEKYREKKRLYQTNYLNKKKLLFSLKLAEQEREQEARADETKI